MTNIEVKVNGSSITAEANGKLTSGMVGVPVAIEYNEEWNGLIKTAIFRVGNFSRDRRNVEDSTTVPWEVMRHGGKILEVGIEGRNANGDIIIPTVWATVARIFNGANSTIPGAPTPDNEAGGGSTVLTDAQMSAQLGNELLTADGWTTNGWTGSFAEGFTHTSGNTNPLTFTPPAGATLAGLRYQISFACSEEISTTSLKVRIGNSELFELYGQFSVGVQGGVGITAVDDSPLEFVPSSTFTGRIYNISVKEITDISEPYFEVKDEAGNTAFQARFSDPERDNAFFGTNAGRLNTSGFKNIGFGFNALRDNTSGFWNTAIGARALEGNDVGSRNIGIGYVALVRNNTGHRNIAIGTYSMQNNTTGHHNIAIGADSLDHNETGNGNVGIGFGALYSNQTGENNVAIGYAAAHDATKSANTAIGAYALLSLTTGGENTALGNDALRNITSASANVAVGASAGVKNKTGIRNTYIGKGADATDTWFSDCIAIGFGAKASKSGQTFIGGTNTTETVIKGNLIVQGTDGVKRQIVFNDDGTVGWTAVT